MVGIEKIRLIGFDRIFLLKSDWLKAFSDRVFFFFRNPGPGPGFKGIRRDLAMRVVNSVMITKLKVTIMAVAATVCAVCICVATPYRKAKENCLTVTDFNFDEILDGDYDEWFRRNLRCSQENFYKICDIISVV